MTIEEMRKHEWQVSWSGGKDSTATIILMHENNIPIKHIVYVRMMFDDNIPATLPIMTNFVDRSVKVFRDWGYDVNIVKSKVTAFDISERHFFWSANAYNNGNKYGISPFAGGACAFAGEKMKAIKSISPSEYEMIGYAADEYKRIHRLGGGKQSILVTLGVEEKDTFDICKKYNLLSPLYDLGFTRDGCWFCPNVSDKFIDFMKQKYPEYVRLTYDMIDKTNIKVVLKLTTRNNWIRHYLKEFLTEYEYKKAEKAAEQEDEQISLLDYFDDN